MQKPLVILLSLSLISLVDTANAQRAEPPKAAPPPNSITWRWRRHHALDYAASGVLLATTGVAEFAFDGPSRWFGAPPFDSVTRDAFVLNNHDDRVVAARVSDVTLGALVAQALIVDPALVAWAGHGDSDTAWQMAAMDLEMMAFTLATTITVKRLAARERPAATACRNDPKYDQRCRRSDGKGSFFSGHTSVAFTAAALTCNHHTQLPLYGGSGDIIACVAAVFGAATVGFERVLADRHYISDVLAGAAVGILSGGVLPWGLYYSRPIDKSHDSLAWSLAPTFHAAGAGVSMRGAW